jgi:cobalt-zinc-cadmium resistance protein CzcA
MRNYINLRNSNQQGVSANFFQFIAYCKLQIATFNQGKNCLLPIACCLLFFSANAQEFQKIDLNQAIEKGLNSNKGIQATGLDLKMQQQLRGTAYDIAKTQVNGTFGQLNTNAQDKNFSISQAFSPFQYGAAKKLLNENITASQLRLGAAKQDITYAIRQSWNTILYYTEMNKMLQKQNALMQKFVRSASLKYETGESNSLEKITAVSKQQDLEQRIKQNEALLKSEKFKVSALLNLDADFAISDTTFTALPTLELLDAARVKQNAVVQVSSQNVAVAKAANRVDKAVLWPDLTAGYFIQSFKGSQEVNGQATYYDSTPRFSGFTVGIAVPVFAGTAIARSKASKINIEIQQKNAEYQMLQLQSQYKQELEQLTTYESVLAYYKNTALPNADIIAENATKGYKNGDISYVEYVQVLQTALDIRTNYISALNNYNTTVINLQYLVNL